MKMRFETRVKRGLLWLAAAVLTSCMIAATGMAAQYNLSQNDYISVKSTPAGKTGQTMTISMVFTNNSEGDMREVTVMFDKDVAEYEYYDSERNDSDGVSIFPFEITDKTFDEKKVGNVKKGSSRTVTLNARVRRDISEGYYVVPIIVNSEDGSVTDYINVWITKSAETEGGTGEDSGAGNHFELGEGQSTPYGVYPNVMNFSVNLRNKSSVTAMDVDVRMELSEDSEKFPFDINDGNYIRHYESIGSGEIIEVPYSMAIRKDVYSGYYPIKFTIEYKDSSEGDPRKEEQVFYVRVQNKEKEEETSKTFDVNTSVKARIIVDSYETRPATVYAGEEFELILRMKNASENVPASNLLFSLESEKVSESAVFTTESGSSSVVVNSLPAGKSTELRFMLQSKAGVDQRSYGITINEKYDSPEFKNAEEKVAIDIPVRQVARLNTGTIEVMPESIEVGSESNVMFPINNTGKVQLYNVMVAFEADSIQKTDAYIGNIKPGETGNVDIMLSGVNLTADDGKVKISITYEDENGVMAEPIEKELTLFVTEAMEDMGMGDMEMTGDMETEAPAESSKYKVYLLPAAAVLAAVAAVVVIRRRKKKKKAAEEDEVTEDEIS